MTHISEFAAIDPLALLLPSRIYPMIAEKLHPHVPKVAELRELTRDLTAQEKAFILARTRTFAAYAKALEEAVG